MDPKRQKDFHKNNDECLIHQNQTATERERDPKSYGNHILHNLPIFYSFLLTLKKRKKKKKNKKEKKKKKRRRMIQYAKITGNVILSVSLWLALLISCTFIMTSTETETIKVTGTSMKQQEHEHQQQMVPELCSPFGSYPNLLNITTTERLQYFSPVIYFPKYHDEEQEEKETAAAATNNQKQNNRHRHRHRRPVRVNDKTHAQDLATPEDIIRAKKRRQRQEKRQQQNKNDDDDENTNTKKKIKWKQIPKRIWQGTVGKIVSNMKQYYVNNHHPAWSIGRFDENRLGMYSSEMFQNEQYQIDGYGGKRTVHLGIDLGGPVGTNVHAFTDGTIHSVGCNSEFGDYGHVIVIEHELPSPSSSSSSSSTIADDGDSPMTYDDDADDDDDDDEKNKEKKRVVWALYGHLDERSTVGKVPGMKIQRGQVIGHIGDCHENGGWIAPHVHFQVSIHPPKVLHDMPGACSVSDRSAALYHYLDPRYILGELH